ncbi:MAG: High-affinity branched-chain amino acid transport ATP-binding protein LivF [Acidimicrobiaceae bacterium]|nr:High-affinity branched-chain amino acid transport ATP-binding protein LivF [Acidimicrobiaceae bacterium]
MTDILALDGVSSGYGDLIILRDITFSLAEGTVTVLLGPNGAGKTTLLRAISGLNPVKRGTVTFRGTDVAAAQPYRRRQAGIGLVQENKRVFKRLTVQQNLAMGSYGLRMGRAEVADRIDEAYEWFPALAGKRDQAAGFLSGGQQQMLAISQAMVAHPALLMLDEPFSGRRRPSFVMSWTPCVASARKAGERCSSSSRRWSLPCRSPMTCS